VLAEGWTPTEATEPNGAVWPTLATAVWSLRQGWSFEEAMRHVIDIGGDTDTIACVSGGLLGARYDIQSIPSRWTTPLNGALPDNPAVATDLSSLMELTLRLDGAPVSTDRLVLTGPIEPVEVEDGLWLSDLAGAANAPDRAVVISLCRTFDYITVPDRRQVYLTDDDHNLDVVAVLDDVVSTMDALLGEGRRVLVHCYGGASRTGLVYRAWLCRNRNVTAEGATQGATMTWPHTGLWNDTFTAALDGFRHAGQPR
jgi:ADP-ribosyl-[dinitrogen reductase] hydrolase